MGSETLPSACYILSDEYSIPFYSTSNGYKNCLKKNNAFERFCSPPIFEYNLKSHRCRFRNVIYIKGNSGIDSEFKRVDT